MKKHLPKKDKWLIKEKTSISPYSVRMRENTDQNNSEYGHFLHSGTLQRKHLL